MQNSAQSSLKSAKLAVKKSAIHGYGVFAAEAIAEGAIIEECYALPVNSLSPDLENYYFNGPHCNYMLLGYGCIYNHDDQPNASYRCEPASSLFIFTARRPISLGEEILVFYGKEWFGSRQLPKITQSKRLLVKRLSRIASQIARFTLVLVFIIFLRYIFQQ